ncbi:MAG: polysaccharide pyruvyl transferase family protein [Anaerolineae bacterium]|nr:polysaccharide pyruvyl transferase family protein [Anaerolineae bacterium]
MNKVFLLGAYGQNNVGDEALLAAFLRYFGKDNVIVNSAQPALTAQQFGVQAVGTYWNWPPKFSRLKAMLSADLFVFGGGSLIKEIEGSAFSRVMYLFRILFLVLFARLSGKRIAMLGVGMGPLTYPLYKFIGRWCANLTTVIGVRDTASRDLLLSLKVTTPIVVTADAVFTLDLDKQLLAERALPPLYAAPYIAVIPRYSFTATQRTQFVRSCDHLIERYNVRLVMIPFQTSYRAEFDDLAMANTIQSEMRYGTAVDILNSQDIAIVLRVIANADMVLSARLHALIFASLAAVPSVCVSYEVKMHSFMQELGLPWASLSLAELEQGSLPALLDRAWAERPTTHAALPPRVEQIKANARKNFEMLEQPVSAAALGNTSFLQASTIFFVSATIVNGGNYLFNLLLGRWLGPQAFSDLSLIVTLLLVATFITSTISTTAAKFAASYAAEGNLTNLAGLRRWLNRSAWAVGLVLFAALTLGAEPLAQFFNVSSGWLFVIFGAAMPMFLAQSVDRGILQGQTRFLTLAASYQAEMWVRLIFGTLAVLIGWSVSGAVGAVSLSIVATWWVARQAGNPLPEVAAANYSPTERRSVLVYAGPVLLALIGQILINNSDVLIVKRFFDTTSAGQYAALALIGRMVFFATWSVVTTMFPIVAQRHQRGESHRHLLWNALKMVGAVSVGIIIMTLLIPNLIVNILFGEQYLSIAPLLWAYALATTLYSIVNVYVNYWLSVGKSGGTYLVLVGGIMQVILLVLLHQTLSVVVWVQIGLMGSVALTLVVWDQWIMRKSVRPVVTPTEAVEA